MVLIFSRPCRSTNSSKSEDLGGGVTLIGLVTDKGTIVHHIGGRPAEEDVLRAWRIIGHFAF